ncbi:outer membrane lipoprotein carrier protein LolA [Simiduia sp. 21SJ11W-1]|uniref:outer membrane lipoprotein carrier protein LolA n=1 Tax=Simiduia sp. 21SJ11W-1 TaxID=2909669 RepID=UPI00209E29CA|nr:outer membrane lipoprotein carrier protein LolA [Simiduia sp. 21SJ11W-1]UTA48724.1 outer membrane lipoprotein carrier protein LolA [Simiduia sp. 21SJ11W-1]
MTPRAQLTGLLTRVCVVLCCLLCSPLAQADAWARVAGHLAQPLTEGEFTQVKHIAGLPLPLHSEGRFAIVQSVLRWQTRTPFASELRITPTEVSHWEEGIQVWQADAQAQPMVATLAQVMLSLVAGDVDAMAHLFRVKNVSEPAPGCWQLALQPVDALLAAHITQVHVNGCATVTGLAFTEASGDRTEISLSPAQ